MKIKEFINAEMIKFSLANSPQISFEVTDNCNLDCVYCGYGNLYTNHDKRENKKLDISKAIRFLDYLENIWESSFNRSVKNILHISFYGGEPLMNFSFIEALVNYTKNIKSNKRRFAYSMTTNGLLLGNYIDFLVRNNFSLLISLDGDEFSNSYRITKNGQNSYNQVVNSVMILEEQYPEYFAQKVNFNSVLHNRNSVANISDFFKKKFNKTPRIGSFKQYGYSPREKK